MHILQRFGALFALSAPMFTLLWVVGGCGSGASSSPGRVGEQPSWRKPVEVKGAAPGGPVAVDGVKRPFTFAPPEPASAWYNPAGAAPIPRTVLSEAILAAIGTASAEVGQPPPEPDGRLYAAVGELAAVVPQDGPLAYPLVEFALQRHGIVEPSPHLVIVWGPIDDPAPLLEQLVPRLPQILRDGRSGRPFTRVGIGAASHDGDDSVMILALQSSHLTTEPMPRALPAGGSFRIEGRIKNGYRSPQVFVTRETGKVEHLGEGKAGRFAARLSCDGRVGRQQVEITAEDAAGSDVLANFPVWCNLEAPLSITVLPSEDDTKPVSSPAEAEARMLELVNRDRAAHNLPPLELAADVADVARAHSLDMKQSGVVAHVSATTGSAADRVQAADIETTLVLENIARAYGVAEAQAGLMNSPGHRANLLSADATHIGIGIVFGELVAGRYEVFVTQVFTRVPERVATPEARRLVRGKLDALGTIRYDQPLAALAAQYAQGMSAGEPANELAARMSGQLDQFSDRFRKITTSVVAVGFVDTFDAAQAVAGAEATHYGVGVARGPHAEFGDDALFIVLLLAIAR